MRRILLLLSIAVSFGLASRAATSQSNDYFFSLAQRESGGRSTIVNSSGFMGSYQMGKAALIDIGYIKNGHWTGKDGLNSKADFLNNSAVQNKAIREYSDMQLQQNRSLVGQQMPIGGTMTESGVRGCSHLVGVGGCRYAMKNGCGAATNTKQSISNPARDGNNVCGLDYANALGGKSTDSSAVAAGNPASQVLFCLGGAMKGQDGGKDCVAPTRSFFAIQIWTHIGFNCPATQVARRSFLSKSSDPAAIAQLKEPVMGVYGCQLLGPSFGTSTAAATGQLQKLSSKVKALAPVLGVASAIMGGAGALSSGDGKAQGVQANPTDQLIGMGTELSKELKAAATEGNLYLNRDGTIRLGKINSDLPNANISQESRDILQKMSNEGAMTNPQNRIEERLKELHKIRGTGIGNLEEEQQKLQADTKIIKALSELQGQGQ